MPDKAAGSSSLQQLKNAMVSGNPGPITAQMGTQRNSNLCPYFIGLRNQTSGRFDWDIA